jgi:tetratricopeptide (TPR) repeat protein
VDLFRQLATARPEAFHFDRASSLTNLAKMLSDLGRREEALRAAQEAADLYRRLATARPEAFLPNLAVSLNNLAKRLSDLGLREQALSAAQEAVDLFRQLATARPEAFHPDRASSLNNLANALSDLGRLEEALSAAQEAVETLQPHFLKLPHAHASLMQIMVGNYQEHCESLGAEPDRAMLVPIVEMLKRLTSEKV